jgi:hypothetical protein
VISFEDRAIASLMYWALLDPIPKHMYISDSIILSAPLRVRFDHMRNYSGLDILVMRAMQI